MITLEYVGHVIDKHNTIRYVSIGKDKKEIHTWYLDHVKKGTFKDLKLKVSTRYLLNGKQIHFSKRDIAWLVNGVLFIYLLWRVSSL